MTEYFDKHCKAISREVKNQRIQKTITATYEHVKGISQKVDDE